MNLTAPAAVLGQFRSHTGTIQSLFETRMETDPDRPFLRFKDRQWSWQAFDNDVRLLTQALLGLGVAHGDRVAIMARNSEVHVQLLLSLARIGAIMVPVNPEFGIDEARYVLEHSGVAGVVSAPEMLAVAEAAASAIQPRPWFVLTSDGTGISSSGHPSLTELPATTPDLHPPTNVNPDDTCIIVYSSGTTGFPKGVMHSQRNYVLSGERHIERVWLQPDDHSLCVLPMFHINALFYSVAGTIAAGTSLTIAERFSASQFWQLVADSGATQANLIMAIGKILDQRPRSEFVPGHSLRVVSGAPFAADTIEVFKREFGIQTLIEGYGMTEAPGAFSNPFHGPHKPTSMGKPGLHPDRSVPWTRARIVDEGGIDVLPGEIGELVLQVPTLMQGYYKDPEQTKDAFFGDWFRTGDTVRVDEDGYYHFVARSKDIIRRRGENIAGAELDRVISAHPDVAEVAAVPVASELGEDEILVAVVTKPGSTLSAVQVGAWCAERLAKHKVPRFVAFVESLPHTPTHKVAKFRLRQDPTLRQQAIDLLTEDPL